MNVVQTTFRRTGILAAAVGLLSASLLPTLGAGTAYAAPSGGQVQDRSITLSSSAAGASNVSYLVSFKVASAYAANAFKGIVVDFCNATGGSPIVTDSNCAAPNASFATTGVGITAGTGLVAGDWAATSILSNRAVRLTSATGETLSANDTISFTLTGITNPGGAEGTFYARVITYNSNVGDILSYAAGSEGNTNAIDFGGFALSTADALTVTAKVQESLTFCVYISGANCAGGSGTNVVLGDSNGVLSNYGTTYTSSDSTTNAKLGIASNAKSGVAVKMKGQNLCRVTGASNCEDADDANIIEPQTGTCVADSALTSVEQFGVSVIATGAGTTADADYGCAANQHAFNTANTTSTYGDDIIATSAPSDEVTSTVEFAAKAATTTEAGIYTSSISFIATGTY